MRALCSAVIVTMAVASSTVSAQSIRLSLPDALARAREQSPAVLVALARVDESRARVAGARVRFRENPQFDVSSGPRATGNRTTADLDIGMSQAIETGGQRAARIAGAEAGVVAAKAEAENAGREVLAAAATAFYRVAHAEEALQLRTSTEQANADVLRIATRRYEAGDIAVLDVNLARSAVIRARAARMATEVERRLAMADLSRLIGVAPNTEITTSTSLKEERIADLSRLLAAVGGRPDLRALAAAIGEANAEIRLGIGLRRPDLSVGARVKQEGGDRAVIGGLTITLPTFNSGQELRASGGARAARVQRELEAARSAAESSVRALYDAYVGQRSAVVLIEQEALPLAIESEQLAQRSFEEGELSLADLLVVRRELIDTRLEYLDQLFDAAATAIARDSAAGVLQ